MRVSVFSFLGFTELLGPWFGFFLYEFWEALILDLFKYFFCFIICLFSFGNPVMLFLNLIICL